MEQTIVAAMLAIVALAACTEITVFLKILDFLGTKRQVVRHNKNIVSLYSEKCNNQTNNAQE